LLVALLGVATALMVILMERARDLTVLGYLGLTSAELGKMNFIQALIMGMVAFLISIVCGWVLTYILIYAINYRSFGWSVDVHVNSWVFVKTAILTAMASLAAALYPTYRLTRTRVVGTLHEE
jgi:putative ABC transport system permease protein